MGAVEMEIPLTGRIEDITCKTSALLSKNQFERITAMSSRTSQNTEEHRHEMEMNMFLGGQNYGETDTWMFNLQPVASIIHIYIYCMVETSAISSPTTVAAEIATGESS